MSNSFQPLELTLESIGFTPAFHNAFLSTSHDGQQPARVSAEHRGGYVLLTAHGEVHATITGRLRHDISLGQSASPHVGDWVVTTAQDERSAVITALLPRTTSLWRRAAGSDSDIQVLAANVDTVCVVCAADAVNLRRIERFLALVMEGGAAPVLVVTKLDLCPVDGRELAAVAAGVPVHCVSAVSGIGLTELKATLFEGQRTVALLGPSGVGKSTLINTWLQREAMATNEVRSDGKGRHTTTHRELIPVPGGGAVIDTPGIREVGLLDVSDGVSSAFLDVEELAEGCRFKDCQHDGEPGCAVLEAVEAGVLDEARLNAYRQLQREAAYLERKSDPVEAAKHRQEWKSIHRTMRAHIKSKRR